MERKAPRRARNSSVSPLSQVVLKRDNTILVRQHVQDATKGVHNKLDTKTLLQRDTSTTWKAAILGIWDLFSQYRVFFFVFYHSFLISITSLFSLGFAGQFGSIDILGWVVGLLVTFRQNQAMMRFWEARTAWGKLVTVSRDLIRAVVSHNNDQDSSMSIAMYMVAYAITVKNFLRQEEDSCDDEELQMILSEGDRKFVMSNSKVDRPVAVLDLVTGALMQSVHEGELDQSTVNLVLEPKIAELNECLGACHRIKTTPLPVVYRLTLDLAQASFLFSLPFSMVAENWNPFGSILICSVVNLVLNGLAKLGGQLEDPFGKDLNDLPLGMYTADVMKQAIHITDRWYKPNTVLFTKKMQQQKVFELQHKFRKAQVKAMVVSSLSTKHSKHSKKSSLSEALKSFATQECAPKVPGMMMESQFSLLDLSPLQEQDYDDIDENDEEDEREDDNDEDSSATAEDTQVLRITKEEHQEAIPDGEEQDQPKDDDNEEEEEDEEEEEEEKDHEVLAKKQIKQHPSQT